MNQLSFPAHQQNLPRQLTTFIGRSTETGDIARLISDPACRLLTLVGPGGIGKTRLAIETAQKLVDKFPDGVFWIDLQPIPSTDLMAAAIADALSAPLSGRGDPIQELGDILQSREVLLLMDNFEHLLAGADLLAELLQVTRAVQFLVTSQIALQLAEEWLYPVSGLPYPPVSTEAAAWEQLEAYEAVQLLVERVRQVRPHFTPQDERAGIVRICQLVEGMPLALELAAAWARGMDCAAIAAEIQQSLFFLSSSLRNLPRRHQSMQAVFARSFERLEPAEREIFPQLAVFRGGFRRDAAQKIAGTDLSLLTRLVDNSLLRWQADGRYQMHELLRQDAESRLAQSPKNLALARSRHAAYYCDFLHERMEATLGQRQREAASEIAAEFDNIRAAWQWAVDNQKLELVERAITALSMFFQIRSRYVDAARMYQLALDLLAFADPAHLALRAQILLEMGWIEIRLGRFDAARAMFLECVRLYERFEWVSPPGQGTDPLLGLSTLASIGGDYRSAEELAQRALQAAQAQNHLNNLETNFYQLASIAYARGDYELAQTYGQKAYQACRQTGDEWFMAYCLIEIGRAARALGDYVTARRQFEASYELRKSFADPEGMALSLYLLGDIALRQNQDDDARADFDRSIDIYHRINDRGGQASVLNGLAKTALARGAYETARDTFQRALDIAAEIQFAPLLLEILTACGQFCLQTGRNDQGLALLATVSADPASDQETKTLAQQLIGQARRTVSPAVWQAANRPVEAGEAVKIARSVLSTAISPEVESVPVAPAVPSLVEPLTERELEVLNLIARGLTNREIAERLTVVIGTVKAHNNSIYGKLGVKNRATAILRARELGLIA